MLTQKGRKIILTLLSPLTPRSVNEFLKTDYGNAFFICRYTMYMYFTVFGDDPNWTANDDNEIQE